MVRQNLIRVLRSRLIRPGPSALNKIIPSLDRTGLGRLSVAICVRRPAQILIAFNGQLLMVIENE